MTSVTVLLEPSFEVQKLLFCSLWFGACRCFITVGKRVWSGKVIEGIFAFCCANCECIKANKRNSPWGQQTRESDQKDFNWLSEFTRSHPPPPPQCPVLQFKSLNSKLSSIVSLGFLMLSLENSWLFEGFFEEKWNPLLTICSPDTLPCSLSLFWCWQPCNYTFRNTSCLLSSSASKRSPG